MALGISGSRANKSQIAGGWWYKYSRVEGRLSVHPPRRVLIVTFDLSRCGSDLSLSHQEPFVQDAPAGCSQVVLRMRSGSCDKKESFIHTLNLVSA